MNKPKKKEEYIKGKGDVNYSNFERGYNEGIKEMNDYWVKKIKEAPLEDVLIKEVKTWKLKPSNWSELLSKSIKDHLLGEEKNENN